MLELQNTLDTNWDIATYIYIERDTYTKGIQLRQRHKAHKETTIQTKTQTIKRLEED